ncbi:MAG: ATP-binding protein [Firmicutes bacterium]|nr:ATP-binding protein [Bacillota bacterium]
MNSHEQQAFSLISQKRNNAKARASFALQELYEDKDFFKVDCEIKQLRFEIARLGSQNSGFGTLNSRLVKLQEERAKVLKSKGLTENDLLPKYSCPLCEDTAVSKDGAYCVCFKRELSQLLKESAGVIPTAENEFKSSLLAKISEEAKPFYKTAYRALKSFLAEFPDNKAKNIVLFGGAGSGKTHASAILANALIDKGFFVYFTSSLALSQLFLKYHLAPLNQKQDIFAPLAEADFLVIDDLGAEIIYNNVSQECLLELLELRAQKSTLITTNLDLNSASFNEVYGARVFSRLNNKNNVIALSFNGADLRNK